MEKVIISVVGKDSVGIIANVCTYLAQTGINVLNITQTIVDGYFNMMMIVKRLQMIQQSLEKSLVCRFWHRDLRFLI